MAALDHTPLHSRLALSDRIARDAEPSPRRIVYDGGINRTAGFGLRISTGCKSWVLGYSTREGRERRITIGSFPTWGARQARVRAAELRRLIDSGGDPLGEKIAAREAPIVAELIEAYI